MNNSRINSLMKNASTYDKVLYQSRSVLRLFPLLAVTKSPLFYFAHRLRPAAIMVMTEAALNVYRQTTVSTSEAISNFYAMQKLNQIVSLYDLESPPKPTNLFGLGRLSTIGYHCDMKEHLKWSVGIFQSLTITSSFFRHYKKGHNIDVLGLPFFNNTDPKLALKFNQEVLLDAKLICNHADMEDVPLWGSGVQPEEWSKAYAKLKGLAYVWDKDSIDLFKLYEEAIKGKSKREKIKI